MPFTASLIEVAVRYNLFGKPGQNQCAHRWDGAAIATATPEAVGEAFWNDVKNTFRGAVPNATTALYFTEVFVREMEDGGVYGSYAIPITERGGLRSVGDGADLMPAYVAASGKLTVGSSTTRPGGKRLSPLLDGDVISNQLLGATFLGLMDAWMAKWASPHLLGAPVATGVLTPVIASLDEAGLVTVWQDVAGYSVKGRVSSQLTRKTKPT